MKLPYNFVFAPALKRFAFVYKKICAQTFFGYYIAVFIFALLGMIVSILDIVRIINGGPMLSRDLWRNRLHRSERVVSPETERDLKLMASALSVEHFFMMMIGSLTCNPALLQPWLIIEGIILLLEALLLATRVVAEGIHLSRGELFICALMLHNWLHAFCLFEGCIHKCDL